MPHAFSIERGEKPAGLVEIKLSGELRFAEATALRDELRRVAQPKASAYRIELSGLRSIDGGATAVLLSERAALEGLGAKTEIAGAEGAVHALLELHRARALRPLKEAPHKIGILDQVGRTTAAFGAGFRDVLVYLGDAVAALGVSLRNPGSVNWRDLGRLTERTGADGLPIASILCFLIGLILAFQGEVTLKPYGGNIFVADLVALSLTRELGPLIVAIIVTGRSGAAFAAELGTMRVSEEIDALKTLGLCPYRFLVFPRILALVISVPLLTLVGEAVGLFGGFLVGVTGLDLTPQAYLHETQNRLALWDVGSGLLKSVAFAIAIGVISCERGLSTSGGAEGVGRSTTSSVVTILFHLVVIDFAFTLVYQAFGL